MRDLLLRWQRFIYQGARRPGFIGPFPYLLFIRGAVIVEILVHLQWQDVSLPEWVEWLAVSTLIPALFVTWKHSAPFVPGIQLALLAVDVTIISSAQFLTQGHALTHFPILYYLPILTALEFLSGLTAGGLVLLISLLIIGATAMKAGTVEVAQLLSSQILNVVVLIAIYGLISLEKDHRARLQGRENAMKSLLTFGTELQRQSETAGVVQLAAEFGTKIVHGSFCAVVKDGSSQSGSYEPTELKGDEGMRLLVEQVWSHVSSKREELRSDVQSSPSFSWSGTPGLKSLFAVPLIWGRSAGMLLIASKDKDAFKEHAQSLIKGIGDQTERALRLIRLFKALRDIGVAIAQVADLDRELEHITTYVHAKLGFQYVTISLVDDNRRRIEMVRGKNVAPGWLKRSRHSLDSSDIQAWICSNRKHAVIVGWDIDNRLNREIYERYGHQDLARVWMPVMVGDRVVGTICGGCHRDFAERLITPDTISKLQALAAERAAALDRARPHVLLEQIAKEAMEVYGAEQTSLHIYEADQVILQAAADESGAGSESGADAARDLALFAGVVRECLSKGHPVEYSTRSGARPSEAILGAGVKGVAAFPLVLPNDAYGVWLVHYWNRDYEPSPAYRQLGSVLAGQIEVALQNSFLLRSIAESAERERAASELLQMIHAVGSTASLVRTLNDLAEYIMRMLDADNVVLYQYVADRKRFVAPPIMKGAFAAPREVRAMIGSAPWTVLGSGTSRFETDIPPEFVVDGGFVERESIKSFAALLLRVKKSDDPVGVLFLNYKVRTSFAPEDGSRMEALAAAAAVAVSSARLGGQLKRQISALHGVDRHALAGDSTLQQRLHVSLAKIQERTGATAVNMFVLDPASRDLISVAARPPNGSGGVIPWGEGIIGRVAESGTSICVDSNAPEWQELFGSATPGIGAQVAVPMLDEIGLIGVLAMEHPDPGAFQPHDQQTLEHIGTLMTIDIRDHAYREPSKLDRCLSAVGSRVQAFPDDLETVCRLLLTGITAGASLGFSRASIFLVNSQGYIEGRTALGPVNRLEAQEIWSAIDQQTSELSTDDQKLTLLLESAVTQQRAENAQALNLFVRAFRRNINEWDSALSKCIRYARTILVAADEPDLWRDELSAVEEPGESYPFVCVPILDRNKPIAALLADRRFLTNESVIALEAIDHLERFAIMATVGIRRAELAQQLASISMEYNRSESRRQQLVLAYGQTYSTLAHELKTPLLLAERRIVGLLGDESLGEGQHSDLRKSLAQISRARNVMKNIAVFAVLARDEPIPIKPGSLTSLELLNIVHLAVADYKILYLENQNDFRLIDKSFTMSGELCLRVDSELVDVALRNVLDNAAKYSFGNTPVHIRADSLDDGYLRICIRNRGIPLNADQVESCRERGWRSEMARAVAQGSGTGLWVVDNIMQAHNGHLEILPTTPENWTEIRLAFRKTGGPVCRTL